MRLLLSRQFCLSAYAAFDDAAEHTLLLQPSFAILIHVGAVGEHRLILAFDQLIDVLRIVNLGRVVDIVGDDAVGVRGDVRFVAVICFAVFFRVGRSLVLGVAQAVVVSASLRDCNKINTTFLLVGFFYLFG